LALLVALCALTLAGCGGDDTSATEEWAEDLCTSINTWTDSLSTLTESVQEDPSAEGLRDAFDEAKEATQTFTDDLRALGPPETESGDEAKSALDELSGEIESGVDEAESTIEGAEGASGTLEAISAISATVASLSDEVSATWEQLQQADPGGELQDAFEQTESCEEVRSSG